VYRTLTVFSVLEVSVTMSRWRQDNLTKVFRDVPHFLNLISGLVNYNRPRRSPFTLFQVKHLHQASGWVGGSAAATVCIGQEVAKLIF